jgi:hypothetical protein
VVAHEVVHEADVGRAFTERARGGEENVASFGAVHGVRKQGPQRLAGTSAIAERVLALRQAQRHETSVDRTEGRECRKGHLRVDPTPG